MSLSQLLETFILNVFLFFPSEKHRQPSEESETPQATQQALPLATDPKPRYVCQTAILSNVSRL